MTIGPMNGCARYGLAAAFAATVLLATSAFAQPQGENAALATGYESPVLNLADVKRLAAMEPWRRITIGTYREPNAMRAALEAANMRIGETADEILGRPVFGLSKIPHDLDLVILTGRDLGFQGHVALADIYRRATQLGFALCPPEAGPLLRLQYRNQPVGEFLHMAMPPVATWGGELVDLTVGNAGTGLILLGGDGSPELKLHASVKFVFVRPARVAAE